MDIRNAAYTADGAIDCEIEIKGRWVPFTASEDDAEAFGRRIYATAATLPPAPYVAPEPEPDPTPEELLSAERAAMTCSPLQGKLALGEEAWNQVEAMLSDPETPFAMRAAITSAVQWDRNSQMIDELAYLMGYSPEQVDDLFRQAMNIRV